MKKTSSLLLVLSLLLTILIIPAAAAIPEENTVEPCAFMDCPKCGSSARIYSSTTVASGTVTVSSCPATSVEHTHYFYPGTVRYVLECPVCGTFTYHLPNFVCSWYVK